MLESLKVDFNGRLPLKAHGEPCPVPYYMTPSAMVPLQLVCVRITLGGQ